MEDGKDNLSEDNRFNELLPDEEYLKALTEILSERLSKAADSLPKKPIPISGLSKPRYPKVIFTRALLFIVTMAGLVFSLTNCLINITKSAIIACFPIVLAVGLLILIFVEIFKGAGVEQETEYEQNGKYYRDFEFKSSISSIFVLLAFLSLGLASYIAGFASVYLSLFRNSIQNFNQPLSSISGIYFSIVTFATVGFGDIFPLSALAKMVVSIQIMMSFFLVGIVLTTTISWITDYERRKYERYLKIRRESTLSREALMKMAKVGLYADQEELKRDILNKMKQNRTNESNDNNTE